MSGVVGCLIAYTQILATGSYAEVYRLPVKDFFENLCLLIIVDYRSCVCRDSSLLTIAYTRETDIISKKKEAGEVIGEHELF